MFFRGYFVNCWQINQVLTVDTSLLGIRLKLNSLHWHKFQLCFIVIIKNTLYSVSSENVSPKLKYTYWDVSLIRVIITMTSMLNENKINWRSSVLLCPSFIRKSSTFQCESSQLRPSLCRQSLYPSFSIPTAKLVHNFVSLIYLLAFYCWSC